MIFRHTTLRHLNILVEGRLFAVSGSLESQLRKVETFLTVIE